MTTYQKLLVALDGSDESIDAFNRALTIAKQYQASIILAHVIDPHSFQTITSFKQELADEAYQIAQDELSSYCEKARSAGIKEVDFHISFDSPKEALASKLVNQLAIDLIIIGTSGLNQIERLLIGSVSSYVARHASCDVLITR